MAAFINALAEEGSWQDCARNYNQLLQENNKPKLTDRQLKKYSKAQLLTRIYTEWNKQLSKRSAPATL